MNAKYFLYILVSILTIWSLDAININAIFKKNKIAKARVFYFLLAMSLIYLVTNFLWDLYTSASII